MHATFGLPAVPPMHPAVGDHPQIGFFDHVHGNRIVKCFHRECFQFELGADDIWEHIGQSPRSWRGQAAVVLNEVVFVAGGADLSEFWGQITINMYVRERKN